MRLSGSNQGKNRFACLLTPKYWGTEGFRADAEQIYRQQRVCARMYVCAKLYAETAPLKAKRCGCSVAITEQTFEVSLQWAKKATYGTGK